MYQTVGSIKCCLTITTAKISSRFGCSSEAASTTGAGSRSDASVSDSTRVGSDWENFGMREEVGLVESDEYENASL